MGQKPIFWPNSNFSEKAQFAFQGKFWPAITRQQIELESCSNPVMTSGVM